MIVEVDAVVVVLVVLVAAIVLTGSSKPKKDLMNNLTLYIRPKILPNHHSRIEKEKLDQIHMTITIKTLTQNRDISCRCTVV